MNGKENIINKILTDADAKCTEILSVADASAQAIISDVEQVIARDKLALEKRLQDVAVERQRNRLATAELDAKKYALLRKQQLITRCYELVYERLVKMSEGDRLDFIGSLISKYAEIGETVYVTQADAKGVTQLWLDGFDKKLKLGKKYIKADGGVVLEGSKFSASLGVSSAMSSSPERICMA